MKCENHPTAPATATCEKCSIPLCGFCTNMLGENVYCEKCADIAQLESFVELAASKTERVDNLLAEAETAVKQTLNIEPRVEQKTDLKEKFHMGLVLLCCVIIIYRIAGSISNPQTLTPQQIAVEDRTRNQIEACMIVFWEIANELNEGRNPGDNLRCQDTGLPMTVATIDGDLRISHPRPDLLGLSDIYVTRSNPIPVLVE